MTATPDVDVLADPVEDRTYQLDTSPDGCGGTRWDLFQYRRFEGQLTWLQVATSTSATPPSGRYRDTARGWLRALGHDPDSMDIILMLPDGIERTGPR